MPSRKSSFGVMNSGTQIGIIVGIVVLVVVGIVIFMMYKPSTAPSKQLNFIRIVKNRINTSPTLTGELTDISNTITPMEVNSIIQLKNGTFAAVESSTNQIWTCDTLSGNKTDWTWLSGPGTPGEKTPFPLIWIMQLPDYTFAAIEYYSNVVWTCGTTLSGSHTDWTNTVTGKSDLDTTVVVARTLQSISTMYI